MGADRNSEKCKSWCRSLSGSCDSRKHFWWHANTRSVSWKPVTAPCNPKRAHIGSPNFSGSVEQRDGGWGCPELIWPNLPRAGIPAFGTAVKLVLKPRVTNEEWAPCRGRPKVSHHLVLLCLNLSHRDGTPAPKHPQTLPFCSPDFLWSAHTECMSRKKTCQEQLFLIRMPHIMKICPDNLHKSSIIDSIILLSESSPLFTSWALTRSLARDPN